MPKESDRGKAGRDAGLRGTVDGLLRRDSERHETALPDASEGAAPMTPRDFINKRMRELDKKRSETSN